MRSRPPIRRQGLRRKRIKKYIWLSSFIISLLTPIIIINRTWLLDHPAKLPNSMPKAMVLEQQTEGFTCGVHAMSMVYKAYGLNPKTEHIRARQGADIRGLFWIPFSEGSYHQDIMMVFVQDFFQITLVDLNNNQAWKELNNHLSSGHLAVFLIMQRGTGGLHWVAAQANDAETIKVFDSLITQPQLEGEDYLKEHILTVMLVKPTANGNQAMSSGKAHLLGTAEMKKSMARYVSLNPLAQLSFLQK